MIRPPRTSPFFPSTTCFLFCDVPRFEAHQAAPPSSSPPDRECSFVTCHDSNRTNPLLPLPPLQIGSARCRHATYLTSPTRSSLFHPSRSCVLVFDVQRISPR